jgi:hypothetical protein
MTKYQRHVRTEDRSYVPFSRGTALAGRHAAEFGARMRRSVSLNCSGAQLATSMAGLCRIQGAGVAVEAEKRRLWICCPNIYQNTELSVNTFSLTWSHFLEHAKL